jgi:hypothetical protein
MKALSKQDIVAAEDFVLSRYLIRMRLGGVRCWMSSKRWSISFRSGGLTSVVDEGTCGDEVRVAKKTKIGNHSLGAAFLVMSAW